MKEIYNEIPAGLLHSDYMKKLREDRALAQADMVIRIFTYFVAILSGVALSVIGWCVFNGIKIV